MNQERLIWQGQREEKKIEANQLKISIKGLRDSIRAELNPHSPIEEINHERIAQQTFEMADKLIRLKKFQGEIKALNQSLGIAD